ncbi:MAG: tRNA pseudouridine(38-40) synthase TruA [Spirochaetes bacterium]|nr:tRNA pseudouridine(38-40) synthase TruA [Spirochaetota bacterium]
MNRYALLVQYDGTLFNGWQFQDKDRSIQAEFENGIKIFAKEDVRVTASGRTDSGVHALGQVVHFDLDREISLQRLCIGLNGILPHELSVKNAYKVDLNFHSRFSAVQREYLYIIYRYPLRTPFMRYKAMWINYPIDTGYIREAASKLIGEHDFASFCKKVSAKNGTIRKIDSIDVTEDYDVIKLKFRANAFLHNMIRIIVGTILQMHREGRDPEYITEILNGKDRSVSGFTAPAYGLYLNRVIYNPPLDSYESAF